MTVMDFKIRIGFGLWLCTRPWSVWLIAFKLPPWHIYKIKPTGQLAQIISYFEDGTVRVQIINDDEHPFTTALFPYGYQVFGYGPDDLEIA